MAPLDIQAGDLSERARRLMQLVGRIPFRLDETVVPTVTLADLDVPPYRFVTGPVDFAIRVSAAAGALTFAGAGVSPLEAPGQGAAVINGIVIENGDAAAQSFSLIYTVDVDTLAGFAAGEGLPNIETTPPNGPLGRVPVRAFIVAVAALPIVRIGLVRLQPGTSIFFPWRATLYGGNGLGVYANALNVAAEASFHGTFYPDARPDV